MDTPKLDAMNKRHAKEANRMRLMEEVRAGVHTKRTRSGARCRTRMAVDVARYPYAWPGGYARALVMDDGGLVCARCVREEFSLIAHDTRNRWRSGWDAAGWIHTGEMDAPEQEFCDHCGRTMDSF